MVSKGFPNVTTSGRQYNIGEKPSRILYTYINLHAGTPKPQSFLYKSPGLQYLLFYDLYAIDVTHTQNGDMLFVKLRLALLQGLVIVRVLPP